MPGSGGLLDRAVAVLVSLMMVMGSTPGAVAAPQSPTTKSEPTLMEEIACWFSDCDENKTEPTDLRMLGDYGDATPAEIIEQLTLKRNLSYEDYIDLGIARMWGGQELKAAEAYEVAARVASDVDLMTAALYNKTVALLYAGEEYRKKAVRTAEIIARLNPDNIEIASLRYATHAASNDPLGISVSNDHLANVDPSTIGQPVFGMAAGVVVVTIVAIASLTTLGAIALAPPEDRGKLIGPMMNDYYKIVGLAVIAIVPNVAAVKGGSFLATFASQIIRQLNNSGGD